MKTKMKYVSGGLLLAVGIGTVTLFQNCSAGSLPAGLMSESSSAGGVTPAAAAIAASQAATQLRLNAAAVSVVAGGRVLVTASAGTPPYTYTAQCGTVTSDPTAGTFFVAPAQVGSCLIVVNDNGNQQASATISVTAAPSTSGATQPSSPTVTAVSKPIYRFFNPSTFQHQFADSQSVGDGGNLEGTVYRLMSDGTTGAVPFYRCRGNVQGLVQYMSSTSAGCEGLSNATPVATIGYIYPTNVAGTVPLTRFHVTYQAVPPGWSMAIDVMDHLEQTSSNLPAAGWVSDGVVGYVPTN